MKKYIFMFFLILLSTTGFGSEVSMNVVPTELKFEHGDLLAEITWIKGPHLSDESSFRVDWMNSYHQLIQLPFHFTVTLDMPTMPMQNPPTNISSVLDTHGNPALGSYLVSGIYFTMGGAWDVNVKLSMPNGASEVETLNVMVNDSAL